MSLINNYISAFLNTEITTLPAVLSKYTGFYYNNAMGNGVTWLFLIWTTVHYIFDEALEVLLKRMCYKQYIRDRLKSSVWYLGFSGAAFVYCGSLLFKNVEFYNRLELNFNVFGKGNCLVGFLLLCVFHAHTVVWEGLSDRSRLLMIEHLLLMLCFISTYFLNSIELPFVLTTLISITNIALELTKSLTLLLKAGFCVSRFLRMLLFTLSVILFIVNYMFVIPLTFIVPSGLKVLWKTTSPSVVFFNVTLLSWFFVALLNSVVCRACKHWLYHSEQIDATICPSDIIECSLFLPRYDDAYKVKIIRQEIKDRQAKLISMRKPKNRNVLIQTLKCMVALKRKLNEKRASDSSDSEESEKSDDGENNKEKSEIMVGDVESEDEASEIDEDTSVNDTDTTKTLSETGTDETVFKDVVEDVYDRPTGNNQ